MAQAKLYLEVAELVVSSEAPEENTIATGNAVLAAIAAADAMCCYLAGKRYRGDDHRQAADLLEEVTGDKMLGAALREVIDLKDVGHYGLIDAGPTRAKTAIRRAKKLITSADRSVR